MQQFRIPGDLEVPIKLFGRFTVKDLVRISLPVIPGLVSTSPLLIILGVCTGIGWYGIRPYSRNIDSHLYNLIRWRIASREVEGTDIGVLENNEWDTGVDEKKIKTTSGGLAAVIKIEPTNLDLKTSAEQQALHSIYQTLLETVNYPLQIHSRQKQLSLEDYVDYLEDCSCEDSLLKSDYIEYCEGFEENDLTLTQHFIVLHIEEDGFNYLRNLYREHFSDKEPEFDEETLGGELDSRCREVTEAITTSDLSAERLTGDQLDRYVQQANQPDSEHNALWNHGEEHRRTIQITEYPSTVELAWPLQLLRTQGKVDVTQTVQPCNTGKTSDRLQRISEKLNAEIDSLLASGHRGTNKLEALLSDTEWFLNLLADKEAQPVKYSSCITVHSNSREEAEQTFEKVCNRLDTLGFDYQHPVFKSDLAYRSDSPLYRNGFNKPLLVPASSAAAGFPFATQNTEDSGVIHGTDTYDGTPILLNRYNWSSHSMARMGMVGSGKSYAAKIELLRAALVYNDLEIIVVDPKQEYKKLVQKLGGSIQQINRGELWLNHDITCFTVKERGQKENVELLTKTVEEIYSHVSQNQRKTLVLIDEARILLNDEDGRRILNQFVLEGRDTNTAITLVTQNASHFTHCREGREILDNMPGKVFMRHDRVPDSVVDYFDLSQQEKQELFELRTGTDSQYSEALLHVSGRINTRLRIDSTPQEHAVIQGAEK